MSFLDEIDISWYPILEPHKDNILRILYSLKGLEVAPTRALIFRAFTEPLPSIKVLILGQDPYPGSGIADGLAFSVSPASPIPASLRNIFKEYSNDLGFPPPEIGDLSPWQREGVLLLNTSLTTIVGERDSHREIGWAPIIDDVVTALASRNVCAILWGSRARLYSPQFEGKIESAHPSPLSAHRGFFNSRPFSRANALLDANGHKPINWSLH